jgi:hypothetical protein
VARYWSVDDARAYLPRLRGLLGDIRNVSPSSTAGGNGHGSVGPKRDDAAAAASRALEELEDGGIILRDLSSGLIDFPARGADGVVYLLCWRLSESDLEWWHYPEDGFAGRKPLPRRPGSPRGGPD